jgi:hypothetical protein
MRDAADDEEDETEDRRCPEGKGRPGGVAAAIDALNTVIRAARGRPPDGTSRGACQSQPDGRFSTLQAPGKRLAKCGSVVRKLLKRRHPL